MVMYPTNYKRLRAAFQRSSLRRVQATIRSNEGLAMGHSLPHRFIRNADLVVLADLRLRLLLLKRLPCRCYPQQEEPQEPEECGLRNDNGARVSQPFEGGEKGRPLANW